MTSAMVCVLALVAGAPAQSPPDETLVVATPPSSPFDAGSWSVQFSTGYATKFDLGPISPDFQMIPINVKMGYMLYSPTDFAGPFNGNVEVLLELALAPGVDTFANIIVGPSLLLRYNNTALCDRIIPYAQCGAGFVYSDGSQDLIQRALGQPMEFYLQVGGGLRWLIDCNWSLETGVDFTHISNAGIADRNAGLNCLGVSLGLTYHFGPH